MSGNATSISASDKADSIDTFYLLFCGCLVFFMQCGFGMLEAGSVRSKNTKNIMLKNMLDACIGAIVWWAYGYGVAFAGDSKFIGAATGGQGDRDPFFLMGQTGATESDHGEAYIHWFFQYVFALVAATLVSGPMAERTQLGTYLGYTVLMTGFIYPVIVHWVWSPAGWASAFVTDREDTFSGGCIDFAGSGVVHMTGGIAGFWGALIVGPRRGRYDHAGNPLAMSSHSTVLTCVGTLMLWLGWYGFNPGSTHKISGDAGQTVARAVVTTTLSAAAGGITVVLMERLCSSKMWEVGAMCNGVLAGLVSISAGCATVTSLASLWIGIFGGVIFFCASKFLLHKCKIDDPLDAIAVHGVCGCYAVIANGFLAEDRYTQSYYSWISETDPWEEQYAGVFYGGHKVLLAALVVVGCEIAWVSGCSVVVFGVMSKLGLLRVSAEIEEAGLDVYKHGGSDQGNMIMGSDHVPLQRGLGDGPKPGAGKPGPPGPTSSSTNTGMYSPSRVSVV